MLYKLIYTMSVLGLVLNAAPASATGDTDKNDVPVVLARPTPLPSEGSITANHPQPAGRRSSRILEISPEEMERLRVKYLARNLNMQRQFESARKDARTAHELRQKLKKLKYRSGKSRRSQVQAVRARQFATYHLKNRIRTLECGDLLVYRNN